MGDETGARFDWSSMSEEDRAVFIMWVVGVVLLPIAVPLYVARRFLARLRRRLG
jgi:hypothetical protein